MITDVKRGVTIPYIDQTLHGYDRGHKELVSSTTLDDLSRATMLVLSDSLSSTSLEEGESYLTSYPLREASKHVLARTWTAGRSYRPGSVWTHSLILDYQALALIPDLVALLSLFKHPESSDRSVYAAPVPFLNLKQSHVLIEKESQAINALMQIYSKNPKKEVRIFRSDSESDEILSLALWRQMWPALRRDFAFITCVSDDLSHLNSGCVLRFSDHEYDLQDSTNMDPDEGYRNLLQDLPDSGPTALRSFLSRYVIESKRPRQLAIQLAKLQGEKKNSSLKQQLNYINSMNQGEPLPRLVRDTVIEELKNPSCNSNIIDIVRVFRDEIIDVGSVSTMEWTNSFSRSEFQELLDATNFCQQHSFGESVFTGLVLSTSLEKLVLHVNEENRLPMLRLRPELVNFNTFWPNDDEGRAELLSKLDYSMKFDIKAGIEVFGYEIGIKTVRALLIRSSQFSAAVLMLMLHGDEDINHEIALWIVNIPFGVDSLTSMHGIINPEIIEGIARAKIQSGKPVLDVEASSWLKLLIPEEDKASMSIKGDSLVIGYLSALVLDDSSSILLAKTVYDPLQKALENYQLSRIATRYLDNSLPYPRSTSLRKSIARSAVYKWPPLEFLDRGALSISEKSKYFKDLVQETESRYGRERFLDDLNSGAYSAYMKDRIEKLLLKKPSSNIIKPFWWF